MEIDGVEVSRRRWLMLISIGAGTLAALAASVPILGFLVSPMLRKFPALWQDVGPIEQFHIGETVQVNLVTSGVLPWDGPSDRVGAWLRRNNQQDFTAFSSKCTHLGCPVRWMAGAELFMCPCHGGVYFKDGDVAAGPPPVALQQFAVRVANGQVQVQWKSEPVKYVRAVNPLGCQERRESEDV